MGIKYETLATIVQALQDSFTDDIVRIQPKTMQSINVTSENYIDSNGFLIFIPSSFTGDIYAIPYGNETAVTFSSYETGAYLRGGALFKTVTTSTVTKTGLEAWN